MSKWIEDDAEWLEATHPEHDRTSCNDDDLYNAGTVRLPPRCNRCDALWRMRAQAALENADAKEPTHDQH